VSLIRIRYKDAGVLDKLKSTLRAMTDKQKLMSAVGVSAEASIKRNFDRQEDSKKIKWKPSIRATMENGQTLVDTGKLRAISYSVESDYKVLVGTPADYGIYHQYGKGQILPKNGSHLVFHIGRTGPIFAKSTSGYPKREWLYISEEGRGKLINTLNYFFEGAKKK